jgi:hypothetical protein
MQQSNFLAAEVVYRKALSIGPDNNKVCNLGICLMKQGRMEEAKSMLQSVVPACPDTRWGSDSHLKSYERAQEMLVELEASMGRCNSVSNGHSGSLAPSNLLKSALWQPQQSGAGSHQSQKGADVEADHTADFAMPFAGALSATAGFGPTVPSRPVQKKVAAAVLGQQQQQRTDSHEVMAADSRQFRSYEGSNFSAGSWDDYEPGYTSPDENVDTNVQGGSNNDAQGLSGSSQFQQQMHWPGESLRNKQESFSAALLGHGKQPLADRKLERSLTFSGTVSRDNHAYSPSMGNYGYPSTQNERDTHHQRTASENLGGRNSTISSPLKPATLGERVERVPLTQERRNFVKTNEAFEDENDASKHLTGAWGKSTGALLKSPLGSSEVSFFSRWGYSDNNRPAVRRSLSLESFDTQLEQIALENEEAGEVALPLQPKRPRNQIPVDESSGLWNSLGFTFPSDGQYANNQEVTNVGSYVAYDGVKELVHRDVLSERQRPIAEEEAAASSNSSFIGAGTSSQEAEMIKRQRRLRVFQEITLFPGSPQHVI